MDNGLIQGITEGLRSAITTHRDESDRLYKRETERKKLAKDEADADERLGLLREQRENEKMKLGLKKDDQGNWVQDPESIYIAEKKQEGLLRDAQTRAAEAGIIKTQAETQKINADRIRGPKGTANGGKIMPTGAVENLAGSDQALRSLEDLSSVTSANPEMFGKGVGIVGNLGVATGIGDTATKAASLDADLMSKAQVIGRYLEGGKLAEGDAKRYAKMLPARGDKPEIVENKISSLKRMIEQKLESDRAAYGNAGYNVGEAPPRTVSPGLIGGIGKQKSSTPAAPKPGTVQAGYKFKGGDPGDQSNWEKVK